MSAERLVVEGEDAESAVVETAAVWKPDLIIMTTTNRTDLDRWLHGGVAEDVIKSATVPVVVVPPDWIRPFARQQRVRLLVPLDGSRQAEYGLDVAVRLGNLLLAELVLLRVVPNIDSPGHGAEDYVRQTEVRIESALPPDTTVLPMVASGSVSSAILRIATDVDADAIVMSTHRSRRPGSPLGRTVASTSSSRMYR